MSGRIRIAGRFLDGGNIIPVALMGYANDSEGIPVLIDPEQGALVQIPWVHYMVHVGRFYHVDTFVAVLGNNNTLIIASPDPIGAEAHWTVWASCGGDATVELVEGATVTGGVAKQARNLNRNYPDGINAAIDPALAGGAIIAGPIFMPGGTGPQAVGGAFNTRDGLEWECNPAESYAVRLTNVSGQNQPATLVVNFYVP